MNRDRAKKLLPIIQHFADGGEIECKQKGVSPQWLQLGAPAFDDLSEYRIAQPKPPKTIWVGIDMEGNQFSPNIGSLPGVHFGGKYRKCRYVFESFED